MAQVAAPPTLPNKPANLKVGDELNRGAWGAVYNGELEGHPVAVKRIHELLHQGRSEEERRKVFEDFREECEKLQALSHPHVVGFIGAFNDPRLGPILVMEKMQENLRQFLDKCKKGLRLPKQLRISLEIIRGVAFLHEQTPLLVHRDLNDKNVMFSFEGIIKIGDFGQSKLKKDLYLTSGQPGMVTFMPPEALKDATSKYNESLDIFSVGVLMLEIGTQQEPLVDLHGIGTIREVDRRERDLKALGEEHPLRPQILRCLKDNPKERPKASDLQREVLALVDGGVEALDIARCREAEDRVLKLEAELKAIQNDAKIEKDHLLEQFRKTHMNLNTLLSEKDETIQRLEEDLRTMSLNEAINEVSEQQLQRERESQEEMVRRLKQQHQEEVDKLKASIGQLQEWCEQLEAQAITYKSDFEQERADREKAVGKLEDQRLKWQADIARLDEQLRAQRYDECAALMVKLKSRTEAVVENDHRPTSEQGKVTSATRPEISDPYNFRHISHIGPK